MMGTQAALPGGSRRAACDVSTPPIDVRRVGTERPGTGRGRSRPAAKEEPMRQTDVGATFSAVQGTRGPARTRAAPSASGSRRAFLLGGAAPAVVGAVAACGRAGGGEAPAAAGKT